MCIRKFLTMRIKFFTFHLEYLSKQKNKMVESAYYVKLWTKTIQKLGNNLVCF